MTVSIVAVDSYRANVIFYMHVLLMYFGYMIMYFSSVSVFTIFLLYFRYEREEAFMALNLGVTSCQSLEISLDQFVRGEVLEGSNAYYCEKCKEKVLF